MRKRVSAKKVAARKAVVPTMANAAESMLRLSDSMQGMLNECRSVLSNVAPIDLEAPAPREALMVKARESGCILKMLEGAERSRARLRALTGRLESLCRAVLGADFPEDETRDPPFPGATARALSCSLIVTWDTLDRLDAAVSYLESEL